jgi:hypothetical protein
MSNEIVEVEPAEFPAKGSSGSGVQTGYSVEARHTYSDPIVIAGTIYHQNWRRVQPDQAQGFGVPAAHPHYRYLHEHNLMTYPAAQAIRWWLHAIAEAESIGGGLCLETRLIKHKVEYSHAETKVSVHAQVGGDDRSNRIPDWGKK